MSQGAAQGPSDHNSRSQDKREHCISSSSSDSDSPQPTKMFKTDSCEEEDRVETQNPNVTVEKSDNADKENTSDDQQQDNESSVGPQDSKYLDFDEDSHEDGIYNSSRDPQEKVNNSRSSWGCPFDLLAKAPSCFEGNITTLPQLKSTKDHRVFFDARKDRSVHQPYTSTFSSQDCVKMPFTGQNPRGPSQVDRWEKIKSSLKPMGNTVAGFIELKQAICSYNSYGCRDFKGLDRYLHEYCNEEQNDFFFTETLPRMIDLAFKLPDLINEDIPLLKRYTNRKLTFTQEQVASLLANAFLCTFENRDSKKGGSYPSINFISLFANEQKMSKIKCILHYFERVTRAMPYGTITYTRRVNNNRIAWKDDRTKFALKVHLSPEGTIEDKGCDMLQVDFANKYVGGGVLGRGCVQEEIRFLICPEMILSRLFTECLTDDEVLVMTGCERYSSYTGYASTFEWSGNFEDNVGRDSWGRRYTEVVAMDALNVNRWKNQFDEQYVERELNKAYCAFSTTESRPPAVCTGNWGCGAFGGNQQLKTLIQLMAACKAGRDMCYCSVGDRNLCMEVEQVLQICRREKFTVGYMCELIQEYSKKNERRNLFEYICNQF